MGYTADRKIADLFDLAPLEACARRIAERCQDRLHELVTEYTPVSDDPFRDQSVRRPGTLKRSWEKGEVEVISTERIRVTVETFDPVAPHVEWDTSPHLIRARKAAALRFFDRATGELVFAQEVHHPGTTGAHMMARALAQLATEWEVIARREMRTWEREQVAA